VAGDLDAEFAQQQLREGPDRDAHRGFARARALQDVAQIAPVVFHSAHEVGVSGARPDHLAVAFERLLRLFRGHHSEPVIEILIFDHYRHGRPERLAMPHSREDLRGVRLDLHPPAAPVALLPPPEFVIDEVLVNG
jgi:hypothetical protein